MSSKEEARKNLDKVINDTINFAPRFYEQAEEIKRKKKEFIKLNDEELKLNDQIQYEERFSSLSGQTEFRDENCQQFIDCVEQFKIEALNNAKYARAAKKTPLIYKVKGLGTSPLLKAVCNKSYIIKKKADITRKMYYLHKLRQRIYCLSEGYDDEFIDFLNSQNPDIPNFNKPNFSSCIKNKLLSDVSPSFGFVVQNSITNLSNYLPTVLHTSKSNENDISIPLSTFSFRQSQKIISRDISNDLLNEFNKLISPILQELISNIDDLLNEIKDIFQVEESNIRKTAENFFRINSSFINSASVLCSNIIFKSQEKIAEAQKIIFLINQKILPPNNQIINESHHIQVLLDEILSIFNSIYDRLRRNQIICQKNSEDFDRSKLETFTIDEVSRLQIEKCNSIIEEMKKVFAQSLSINNSFQNVLNNILAQSKDQHSSNSYFDTEIKIAPPKLIPKDEIKQKFLLLKQQILQKQAEQVNSFCEALEELPPELREIKIKDEYIQNNDKTPINRFVNPNQTSPDIFDNSYLTSMANSSQIKSNPYQDSNQNLYEKLLQKVKEKPNIKLIEPKLKEDENEDKLFESSSKYYKEMENIKSDLSSTISHENIEELKQLKNSLLEELHEKKEKLKISKNIKNEKIKIKLNHENLIKAVKDKRESLMKKLDEVKSKNRSAQNSLKDIQNEIVALKTEHDELETQQFRAKLLQSKYHIISQSMQELEEEEKKFDEETQNQKK